MEQFYFEIRAVHICAAAASFSLFLLRGLIFNAAGARWALSAPLRYVSWTVDGVLLTAALMLATVTGQAPFIHGWLTVKVLLLVPYILLGYFALRGATARVRWISFVGAVVTFAYIYSVARAHHPLGFFV